MKTKSKSKSKAFTLIELLIVIGIIGIMSGFLFVVIDVPEWRKRAQDTVRKEDISTLSGALERYYSDKNTYPIFSNYTGVTSTLAALLSPNYIKTVPNDPLSSTTYYQYKSINSGQGFCVCASLQSSNASVSAQVPAGCATVPPGYTASTTYCITNPF